MTYGEWWRRNKERSDAYFAQKREETKRQNHDEWERTKKWWKEHTYKPMLMPWIVSDIIVFLLGAVITTILILKDVDTMWIVGFIAIDIITMVFFYSRELYLRKQDPTRCPMCNNTKGIKYARHGYEFEKAWDYSMLGVKSGRYVAGFNYNKTDCHCPKCGYTWMIDIDYRFLK